MAGDRLKTFHSPGQELTYRTCPRELARSVTRLYLVNLKTARRRAPARTINAQIVSLSLAPGIDKRGDDLRSFSRENKVRLENI